VTTPLHPSSGRPGWTALGAIGARDVAIVDEAGGVGPGVGGWRVEWWVRSEERWHITPEETAVRHTRGPGRADIETRLRVPGGDMVGTAWVALDRSGSPTACVAIENTTAVPVAVALVLRPDDVSGHSLVRLITVTAESIDVDAETAVRFDREPSIAIAGPSYYDVRSQVLDEVTSTPPIAATSNTSTGSAAAIFPLPHRATMRATIAIDRADRLAGISEMPVADAVARGWDTHLEGGITVATGDPELDGALDGARGQLLVAVGDGHPGPRPGSSRLMSPRGRALVGLALLESGFTDGAIALADGLGRDLQDDDADAETAATASVLVEAIRSRTATIDPDPELLARAVDLIDTARRRPFRRPRAVRGLVAGVDGWWNDDRYAAEHMVWACAGLDAIAASVAAIGQPDAAASVAQIGDKCRAAMSSRAVATPADPGWALESVLGSGARVGPRIVHPLFDAGLALADAAMRRDAAVEVALVTLTRSRSVTGSWRHGDDGADVVAAAFAVLGIRRFLVAGNATTMAIAPVVPPSWIGRNWELHELPTPAGHVSVAIRWHGDRPALLWETEGPIELTAPGLDAEWRTSEPRGEALLAPHARPPTGPDASFG